MLNRPLKTFRPQADFLGLISTGDKFAIASRGNWSLEGAWAWRLKDWIDRRFMDTYADLPAMQQSQGLQISPGLLAQKEGENISASSMRCGGCGAKVGSELLSAVLTRLQPVHRSDVLIGLEGADDAAVSRINPGKCAVQSVDYFRSFIDDPYIFGQIAAHHALSDLFAMGAEPQSAMAIATLAYSMESDVEAQLFQLMSGAVNVLNQANAALVGGHTGEGAELAFGLSVTGLIDERPLLRKSGMQSKDVLVLCKALGTGTLFAADMLRHAKGRWIDAAIESMLISNQQAGLCLQRHAVNACTDITGFGLIGHLQEMMKSSDLNVRLTLDELPILEGAHETMASGYFSSMHTQNSRLQNTLSCAASVRLHPRYPLLFDPQTAGGLLASIPAARAEKCLDELIKLGYKNTCIIGEVQEKSSQHQRIELI